MFKIKGNDFHVTWGDIGSFNITLDGYTFKSGDRVRINVYGEDLMNTTPIMTYEKQISESTIKATIDLGSLYTQIGDPPTERTTYWYEITLNDTQTPFCYDENGPKYFYVYPGGVN